MAAQARSAAAWAAAAAGIQAVTAALLLSAGNCSVASAVQTTAALLGNALALLLVQGDVVAAVWSSYGAANVAAPLLVLDNDAISALNATLLAGAAVVMGSVSGGQAPLSAATISLEGAGARTASTRQTALLSA
jgi:hypothetical protein